MADSEPDRRYFHWFATGPVPDEPRLRSQPTTAVGLVGGVTAKEFVSPADLLALIWAWQTSSKNTDTRWGSDAWTWRRNSLTAP